MLYIIKTSNIENMNVKTIQASVHIGRITEDDYLEGLLNLVKSLYVPGISNNLAEFQMSDNIRKEFIS